jgi:hypothetical protein
VIALARSLLDLDLGVGAREWAMRACPLSDLRPTLSYISRAEVSSAAACYDPQAPIGRFAAQAERRYAKGGGASGARLFPENWSVAAAALCALRRMDKLHNARAIVSDFRLVGAAVFDRFTATREQTIWYYRRLARIFAHRLGHRDLVRSCEHEVANMTDYGVADDASAL